MSLSNITTLEELKQERKRLELEAEVALSGLRAQTVRIPKAIEQTVFQPHNLFVALSELVGWKTSEVKCSSDVSGVSKSRKAHLAATASQLLHSYSQEERIDWKKALPFAWELLQEGWSKA